MYLSALLKSKLENKNLINIFLNAVKCWPKKIALEEKDKFFSYEELYHKALSIAKMIEEKIIDDKAHCIVIYGEKSFASVASILGVLFSGYAYMYFDTSWPSERLQNAIDIAKPLLVIETELNPFSKKQFEQVNLSIPIIKLSNNTVLLDGIAQYLIKDFSPETIAYILFTSGSTGAPKGVCISHRAAVSALEMMKEDIIFKYEDKIANHAAFCYDLSMFDLFCAFSVGATVNLIPQYMTKVPIEFINHIIRYQLNSLYIVNSAFEYILKYTHQLNYRLPLNKLLLTGDFLTENLFNLIKSKLNDSTHIWNLYSSVEMPYMFAETYSESSQYYKFFSKKGRHVKYEINPYNSDEEGVLVVAGAALFSGYINRETPLQFIQNNPIKNYNTADLVKKHSQGIELLGRVDRQVKVMGNRVELDDIEINIEKIPNIKEAAVFYDQVLIKISVFITLINQEKNSCPLKKIKSDCHRLLPPVMVPHHIYIINEMPRTLSGKKDRKILLNHML